MKSMVSDQLGATISSRCGVQLRNSIRFLFKSYFHRRRLKYLESSYHHLVSPLSPFILTAFTERWPGIHHQVRCPHDDSEVRYQNTEARCCSDMQHTHCSHHSHHETENNKNSKSVSSWGTGTRYVPVFRLSLLCHLPDVPICLFMFFSALLSHFIVVLLLSIGIPIDTSANDL